MGGRVGSARVFIYPQHVGIGIAKVSHWGNYPTQDFRVTNTNVTQREGVCVAVEYRLKIA